MAAALSTRHTYLLWQDVELRHLLFSGDKAKETGALGKSAPAPWLAAAAPAPWLAGAAPPEAVAASAADNEDEYARLMAEINGDDRIELALRRLASQIYFERTKDKHGAATMLGVTAPGSGTDIAPEWMVASATSASKAEHQRTERVRTEQRWTAPPSGSGKGAEGKGKKGGKGKGGRGPKDD